MEKEVVRVIQTNKRLGRDVAERQRVVIYGVEEDSNTTRSKTEREELNTLKNLKETEMSRHYQLMRRFKRL